MHTVYTLENNEIPFPLQHIPQPPKKLFVQGSLPEKDKILLCVVGSRHPSSYGEKACRELILGLKGYNICIVSGLAIGIDSIAHRAALEAGLQTIAFPGSGLDEKVLYPQRNKRLANEILYADGALISEFSMDEVGAPWNFPKRNRLMAGISKATLVIEASLESGTLITSRLALDYGRDVGAVPGQIFSPLAAVPHMLIRDGATPVTCSHDILEMLGFNRPEGRPVQHELFVNLNKHEKEIIKLLQIEPHNNEELVMKANLDPRIVNEVLSSLEIQGLIEEKEGRFRMK